MQDAAFDLGEEVNGFAARQTGMGAVVSFTGIVRDIAPGLEAMQIEHYPGMTEKAIEAIASEAAERWHTGGLLVIHRYGALAPGDMIMMVATAAPHRADAFQAAEFLMDFLKSRAPFWKKEVAQDGADWVAARDEDEDALDRW